jgi:hypothetical protein
MLEHENMPREADFTGYNNVCIEFLTSQKRGTQNPYKAFLQSISIYGNDRTAYLRKQKADRNNEWKGK